MSQRVAIRVLVGALTVAAVAISLAIGLPEQTVDDVQVVDLPAIALGQEIIYRLEIFILLFYGGLIVLTPVFRGAILGRLPIEVSARGAKFAEEVDESLEATQQLVTDQQGQLEELEKRTLRARLNIDQLADSGNVTLTD